MSWEVWCFGLGPTVQHFGVSRAELCFLRGDEDGVCPSRRSSVPEKLGVEVLILAFVLFSKSFDGPRSVSFSSCGLLI